VQRVSDPATRNGDEHAACCLDGRIDAGGGLPMRIALLNSFYAPEEVGGAERSVRFLAESLVRAGHEVTVICSGRMRRSEQLGGVNVERLPVRNLYHPLDAAGRGRISKLAWHALDSYNPFSARAVREVLTAFAPDVLHTNTLASQSVSVWGVARGLGIPVVHTLRDYYLLCPNTAMFKGGRQCATRCLSCKTLSRPRAAATASVSAVIGNSRFILDRHQREGLFAEASKGVIYNAYQAERVAHVGRDPGVFTLGFIGRLAPTKGVEFLLEAFKAAARGRSGLRLLIAGEGELAYVDRLKQLAGESEVHFLGRVKPEDFYSRIDWCVVPSLWDEPLARVIFEAFAHGVPVVASATGGSPELVITGRTGVLYTPDAPSTLADIIVGLPLGDERYDNYRSAVTAAADDYRPQNVVAGYSAVYAELAASGVVQGMAAS
jgi:glycosyltransferase involved in cell wall biosynthesis